MGGDGHGRRRRAGKRRQDARRTGTPGTRADENGDGYATQPSDPNHVLMTAYGVVSSNDGGMTWHPALRSKVMFGPVAWAPGQSGTAYAVGFDRSLWRSVDGGKTWTPVSG